MGTWWLGPAGGLVQIPAPAVDLDVSPTLIGGVHRSLNGVATISIVAQPRSWPMRWTALTEDQTNYLRLVGLGLVRSPLYLIDGEIRNRLPMRITTGGAYTRTATDFFQAGGSGNTITWLGITDPPAGVPVRGVISWTRTTTALALVTFNSTADRVPLIAGEPIRVSLWARGAAISATVGVDLWDSIGAGLRILSAPVTLSATTWTQLSLTTTPAAGRVSASVLLHVADGQATSTLQTTGWMLSPSSASTTWAIGGGAPIVVPGSELVDTYILTGLRGFGLTLLEANP